MQGRLSPLVRSQRRIIMDHSTGAAPMNVMSSVLEAIGNTPLVELRRLTNGMRGRILLKLDYLNPGFSKKDRAALQMIEEAEQSGALRPGQAVVELTSGNTGTGLAIVCAVRGYPFVAVMSRGNSAERAMMMRALGAEVVLVEQAAGGVPGQVSGEDLKRVELRAAELVRERGAKLALPCAEDRPGDLAPSRAHRRLLRLRGFRWDFPGLCRSIPEGQPRDTVLRG